MKEDEKDQYFSLIAQYSTLKLFDQDPRSPDVSFNQAEQEIKYTTPLMANEELISQIIFKAALESDYKPLKGIYQFIITNYRLIFQDLQLYKQTNSNVLFSNILHKLTSISIPYGYIEQIDIYNKIFIITLKTGLILKIRAFASINNIYQFIVLGVTSIPYFPKTKREEEEAICYDCLAELQRMRIVWQKYIVIPNINGVLCSTYPKYFIIPKGISEDLLKECIKLRNNGRVPVLTYFTSNGSSLWRGSRAKVNQQNNKFNATYLRQIDRNLIIFDIFDETNLNKYQQKNDVKIFKQFQTLPILNMFFKKMVSAYAKNDNVFKIFSKWFQEVYHLITISYSVVDYLKDGRSVVIQEYLDFDRVTQISAIAQIIIDPFYRTIQGFHLLIEKQFISFGHPFSKRLGFQKQKKNESSPIFIQFLQCVNQLIVTHPRSFELSSFYLAKIAYELYTSKYNNFYFNCQKDRLNSKFTNKTLRIQKNSCMRKQYYNYQWMQSEAVLPLYSIRKPPFLKEFMIWREFFDMITTMRAEYPEQKSNKRRKNSIYKAIHNRNTKQI